jgi:hypothetical protein
MHLTGRQTGRDRSERVVAIRRNEWSRSPECASASFPIAIAKSAVTVAAGVLSTILPPQQQQRHAAALQFPVHLHPIGQRPCRLIVERRRREQPALELTVVRPFRHRPGDADDGSPPQILANRRPADPDRIRESAVRSHPGRASVAKTSRTFRIGALSAGIGPPPCSFAKGGWSSIRSPTSRASRQSQQDG